ncbi:MAG: hypothetical protein LHV68_13560 [Elusimicrobia bacterium]|nr:hypothetical protein [Candidatus Liberimonas magnetica]
MKIKSFFVVLTFLLTVLSGFCLAQENEDGIKDAMVLSNSGKSGQAVEKLKQIIGQRQGQEKSTAQMHLGFVYFKDRQFDNALNEFTGVLTVDKDRTLAYYYLGLIYEAKALSETDLQSSKEQKLKALQAWQEFLRCAAITEKKAEAHKNRGMNKENDLKLAERHIQMLKEMLGNE